MLYFVQMKSNLPGDWPDEKTKELRKRETELAVGYIRKGLLRRIFRTVGRDGNCSIWEADTPEELHAALQALPKFPWADISVTPLVRHPVENAYRESDGNLPNF